MSTLKVESLRHYDADSDALTLSSSGTITFNGTLVGATDSAQVQSQFDSAFPSAFDTRFALQDTHDSAAVQAQIDSAAVTLTGTQTITGAKTFVGTTSIGAPLEIYGQGTSNYRHIYVNSNETIGGGITLKASGGIDWSIISTGSGATQGTGDLLFYRDSTDGSSSSMIIKSNGNVGIGTTSPFSTARLQVKTDTNVNLGFQTGTTETSGFKLNAYNDAGNTNIPLELNGSVVLLKTGETERMRIDTGGIVKLITANDTAGTTKRLTFGTNAYNRAEIRCTNAATYDGSLEFWTGNSSNYLERVRINSSGNVGIGTDNPGGALDIKKSSTGVLLSRVWNPDTSGTGAAVIRIANSANNNDGNRLEFSDANYYTATISADRTQGLIFRTSGTGTNPTTIPERMRIDNNGRITTPYQPAFTAYATGNQAPTSATKINYPATTLNRGSHYDTTLSRFTAPVTGYYSFSLRTWFTTGLTGTIYVYLYKNGGIYAEQRLNITSTTSEYNTFLPTWNVYLSANDYVEIYGNGTATNLYHTSSTQRYSEFSGYLLG